MSSLRFVLIAVCCLALAVASCRRSETPKPVSASNPGTASAGALAENADCAFPSVEVRVEDAKPPARLSAGLPTTLAGFEHVQDYPPLARFRGWVCRGERDARAKLLEAVRAAAEAGPMEEKLADRYRVAVRYCHDPSHCTWLLDIVLGDAPDAVKEVLWSGLIDCDSDEALRSFDDPKAPLGAVVEWYAARHGRTGLRPHPRLFAALAERIHAENRFDARQTGVVLGRLQADEAIRFAQALQKRVVDPERKAFLGIGLGEFDDPLARGIYTDACRQLKDEPMCMPAPRRARKRRIASSLAERARQHDFDPRAHVGQTPTDAAPLVEIYRACVGKTEEHASVRARCLERLARLDRGRAVRVAPSLTNAADELGVLARTLVAFPAPGALARRLREWKLVPDLSSRRGPMGRPDVAPGDELLTVWDMMTESGCIDSFDTETGMFPNEHDVLLARLAAMAGPHLSGIEFVEVAPDPEVHGYDSGAYTLHAYADGKRYVAIAENRGDWYDIETVVGLLNVLLRVRKSELRFVPLATTDQLSHVAVGPSESLLAARDAGLLAFGSSGEGERIGKEFERKVFEHLGKTGD